MELSHVALIDRTAAVTAKLPSDQQDFLLLKLKIKMLHVSYSVHSGSENQLFIIKEHFHCYLKVPWVCNSKFWSISNSQLAVFCFPNAV